MIIYENQEQVIIEIRKILLQDGVSQKELAERVNLSPQALNSLFNKKNFCFEDAKRIVNALGYDLVFSFSREV